MELIKLKRQSKDIGIFGKKGSGKTIILTLLGFLEYKINNAIIFSNYPLSFKHVFVQNYFDFYKITKDVGKKKVFLADDFEFWYNSREISKNISLNEILLNFGKFSCSTYYTAKREMAIDKSLRESTNEFWEVDLRPKYFNSDYKKNRILNQYLNNLYIKINRFDYNLDEIGIIIIDNLHTIAPYFETTYTIKPLEES